MGGSAVLLPPLILAIAAASVLGLLWGWDVAARLEAHGGCRRSWRSPTSGCGSRPTCTTSRATTCR